MKRLIGHLLVILFTLSVSAPLAHSAVTPGAKCLKVGIKEVYKGKTYTCTKSGNKLVWDKGVVAKKNQIITVDPIADVEVSQTFFSINASASSGLMVKVSSTTPQVCQINILFIVFLNKAGYCSLTLTQTGNNNFNAATPLALSFNVTKMTQKITTSDDLELEIAERTQTIYWSASSGLDVTLTSLTPRICTVQGRTLTLLALGICEIQGNQPGNDEYQPAASFSFKYELVRAAQQIEFNRINDTRVDKMNIELEAYSYPLYENRKPIYTTSTPKVCVIEESRVLLLTPGECTVLATNPGNDLYAPAPIVSQTFKVLPARVGSLQNPAMPGVTIKSEQAEITFIEYTEKVDMFAICKKSYFYDGCTTDKDFNGIPDLDWENKLVALLFEYKNISNSTSEFYFSFIVVHEGEFVETSYSDVPRELEGKKLLPNTKARGFVYMSIPKNFDMKNVILLFESFDPEGDDVYFALRNP